MSAFLSHPHDGGMPFNVIRYFGPDWWFLMHMIQTPLIVIIAFGLLLLTDAFGDTGEVHRMPSPGCHVLRRLSS